MQIIPDEAGRYAGGGGRVPFLPIKNPNDPLLILIGNPSLTPNALAIPQLTYRNISFVRNLSLNINAIMTRGAETFYNYVQGSRRFFEIGRRCKILGE